MGRLCGDRSLNQSEAVQSCRLIVASKWALGNQSFPPASSTTGHWGASGYITTRPVPRSPSIRSHAAWSAVAVIRCLLHCAASYCSPNLTHFHSGSCLCKIMYGVQSVHDFGAPGGQGSNARPPERQQIAKAWGQWPNTSEERLVLLSGTGLGPRGGCDFQSGITECPFQKAIHIKTRSRSLLGIFRAPREITMLCRSLPGASDAWIVTMLTDDPHKVLHSFCDEY